MKIYYVLGRYVVEKVLRILFCVMSQKLPFCFFEVLRTDYWAVLALLRIIGA